MWNTNFLTTSVIYQETDTWTDTQAVESEEIRVRCARLSTQAQRANP